MRLRTSFLLLLILVSIGFGLSGCSQGNPDTIPSARGNGSQLSHDEVSGDSDDVTMPETTDAFDELDQSIDESSLDIIEDW